MNDDELLENSERLKDEVAGLRDDLREFIGSFENYRKTSDKRSRKITIAIFIITALVVLVIFAVLGNRSNAMRLESVVQAAICPENAFLVGGYDPNTRTPGYARESYEQAFEGMRYGRVILNCQENPVPKRIEK